MNKTLAHTSIFNFFWGSEVAGDINALIWRLVLEIYKFIGDLKMLKMSDIINKITVKLSFLSRIIVVAIMKIFVLFQ